MVCSSHLPPAPGAMLDVLVDSLALAPDADRFVGPDHAAHEAKRAPKRAAGAAGAGGTKRRLRGTHFAYRANAR